MHPDRVALTDDFFLYFAYLKESVNALRGGTVFQGYGFKAS